MYDNFWDDAVASTWTSSKDCHKGNVLAFEAAGLRVFGGGSSHNLVPEKADVWIQLAWSSYSNSSKAWKLPAKFKSAKFLVSKPDLVIPMEITDGAGLPASLTADFWTTFWVDLQMLDKRDILVSCMGGHGRTGMVLTCLALAAGVVPAGNDPVAWIRDRYCEKAVETKAQITYIEEAFGVKVASAPKPIVTPLSTYKGAPVVPYYGTVPAERRNLSLSDMLGLIESGKIKAPSDRIGEMTLGEVRAMWKRKEVKDYLCDFDGCDVHPHTDCTYPNGIMWRNTKKEGKK